MATVIIAKNQTAGDLGLTNLSVSDRIIPASGQVTLTDYNYVWQIQEDPELKTYIDNDQVLLRLNGVDLNKAESQGAISPPAANQSLDAHVTSTSNPHSVTKTQVGLSDVTNDAQLKRAAGDFGSFTDKSAPADADVMLIEDSDAANVKKKILLSNLPVTKRVTNLMTTGILTGGELSINVDNTKFDIAAGTGYVVNNYTDPLTPVRTTVTWTAKTAITVTNLATEDITYVALNSSEDVIQSSSRFTPDEYKDYIVLGALGHPNRTSISYISIFPALTFDVGSHFHDFADAFGAFNIDGNIIEANNTDLRVKRSAGKVFKIGANYATSKKTPNIITSSLFSPQYFFYSYRNVSGDWTAGSVTYYVDPDHYDPGGGAGLVALSPGDWTIQYFFLFPDLNLLVMQYGQTIYASKNDALGHINDSFTLDPDAATTVFRGYLVVTQGTTDLSNTSNAAFITAGKFGLASIITGGGGGEANTASNIGTSGIGPFAQKSGVDLQFKNIKAASTKISVTDNPTPHTIDLDVVPGNVSHTAITDIGSNTHATIDSHLASTSNPHSVTKTQVGLSAVTNDAQIKSVDFPASSVDNEIALFNGVGGKSVKRATTSGILKGTAGVISAATAGTDYEPPIAAGTTAQYWRGDKTWQTVPLPTNFMVGLDISRNASYPDSRIDIQPGTCRSLDDTTNLVLTTVLTVNLAASGANGLDTGSEASNTWYYTWLIYNPTTVTYAGLLSTSSTSPTMPSGYTKRRRLGSTYNNSSSNFRKWDCFCNGRGREYRYCPENQANVQVLSGGGATSFTDVNCGALVPPTTTPCILNVAHTALNSGNFVRIRTNGVSESDPMNRVYSGTSAWLASSSGSSYITTCADASGIIEYQNSNAGNSTDIWVAGYIEKV